MTFAYPDGSDPVTTAAKSSDCNNDNLEGMISSSSSSSSSSGHGCTISGSSSVGSESLVRGTSSSSSSSPLPSSFTGRSSVAGSAMENFIPILYAG
jgi:hypothetical protein